MSSEFRVIKFIEIYSVSKTENKEKEIPLEEYMTIKDNFTLS